jgi:hypothetical protein
MAEKSQKPVNRQRATGNRQWSESVGFPRFR